MEDVSLTERKEPPQMPSSAISTAPAPTVAPQLMPSPAVGGVPPVIQDGSGSGLMQDDPTSSVPTPTFGSHLMRFGKSLRQEAAQAAEVAAERAKAAAEQAALLSEEYKVKERVDRLRKDASEAADSAAARAKGAALMAAEEAKKAAVAAEQMLGLEHELPGTLESHGVVVLPGQEGGAQVWEGEWEEHLRDFNRTWGSGSILLVDEGLDAAADEAPPGAGAAKGPVKIESLLSTFDAEACGDDKLRRLEQTLRQVLDGASMRLDSDQELSELVHRVVYYLTVTPGMSLVLEHTVSPPSLMQPRFVVLIGNNQVRVATYAFCGNPVKGDRPDRKYSPYAVRLLSENQWKSSSGEVDGQMATATATAPTTAPIVAPDVPVDDLLGQPDASEIDPPPPAVGVPVDEADSQAGAANGVAQVTYAARFTRLTDIDAVVDEDYAALAAAVRSGDWSDVFAEPTTEVVQVGQLIGEGTAMLRSSVASSSLATGLGAAIGGAVDGVSSYAKDLKGPSYAQVEGSVVAFLVSEAQVTNETVAKGVCSALAEHGTPRAEWEATLRSMQPDTLQELLESVKKQQEEAAEQAALEPVPLAQDGATTATPSEAAGLPPPHVGADTETAPVAAPAVEHVGDGLAKGWRQMTAAVSTGAAELVAETKKGRAAVTAAHGSEAAAAPPAAAAKGYLKGFGKGLSKFGSKAAAGATAMAGTVADGVSATPAALAKNAEDPNTNTAKIAAGASGLGAWALAKGESFFSEKEQSAPHEGDPAPPVGGGATPAASPAPVDYSQYYSSEAASVVAEVAPTQEVTEAAAPVLQTQAEDPAVPTQAPTALGAPV